MLGSDLDCGESGIRTLDTLLGYTHFPGVLLRPLGQLSVLRIAKVEKILNAKEYYSITVTFSMFVLPLRSIGIAAVLIITSPALISLFALSKSFTS